MRSFASPSFFRLFDLLASKHNSGFKRQQWTMEGVNCIRERHSFNGPTHGFAVEIISLDRSGKRGWKLMVVKEYWWLGNESKALKTLRWARAIGGRRIDILAWFRDQEANLEREASRSRQAISPS
jgi:hypothetical protein